MVCVFGVQLYSVFFKHRLQNQAQVVDHDAGQGVTSRSGSGNVPANVAFVDGIATKDIHIDALTNLSIRIFLPESSLLPEQVSKQSLTGLKDAGVGSDRRTKESDTNRGFRRSNYGGAIDTSHGEGNRRSSYGGIGEKERSSMNERLRNGVEATGYITQKEGFQPNGGTRLGHDDTEVETVRSRSGADAGKEKRVEAGNYKGYLPKNLESVNRRLPIILQFHGGGFVAESRPENPSATGISMQSVGVAESDTVVTKQTAEMQEEGRILLADGNGVISSFWINVCFNRLCF